MRPHWPGQFIGMWRPGMKLIVLHKTKAACLAVCAILVVATAIGIAIRASHADMASVIAREENESYEEIGRAHV